ncbi:hypothetical protein OROGR_029717 [Orobanche gracilis]
MEFFTRIYYPRELSKFPGSFSGLCLLSWVFFFVHHDEILQNPFFSKNPFSNPPQKSSFKVDFPENSISRRMVYEESTKSSSNGTVMIMMAEELESRNFLSSRNPAICTDIYRHKGYNSKCDYLRANPHCNSGGFLNYLIFFYCDCKKIKPLGYIVLGVWLLVLFYLLGNTASDYFCFSLEKLSNLLTLPPTVAGVTLLPLGNGPPDVFASIAAFVGRDSGDVGLNSVLGGAIFVTCIVVGAVSLCVADRNIKIDKNCFIRDVGFFLVALLSLLVIMVLGEVSVGGAIAFILIYVVYVLCVGACEIVNNHGRRLKSDCMMPLLPVVGNVSCSGSTGDGYVCSDSEDGVPHLKSKLSHWVWASNVAIFSSEALNKTYNDEDPKSLWGWSEEDTSNDRKCFSCSNVYWLLDIPFAIPRRLTIPIVEEDRWSKKYAVASVFFAPILLSFLWSITSSDSGSYGVRVVVYLIGALVGCTFGLLALIYTKTDNPPRKFLLPWVLGGFLMSIVWFYIIANELVALLVSFGVLLEIRSSVLALTVLAWGNSMGDLMSNIAIAMNGGSNGVQIAMSGCYAGPMFNTLVGLGVSLLLGAWYKTPGCCVVPRDMSLFSTLGFLLLGLVWALVILPMNDMRPGKAVAVGLIVIYLGFLGFRATLGDRTLDGPC